MNIRALMIIVSCLAIGLYFAGIVYIARYPTVNSTFVSSYVTAIAGTLATYLGAVFGLNRANSRTPAGAPKVELSWLETASAWSYIASLVLAVIIWGFHEFDVKYAETIRNLALTLPGIFAGVLAVALNVEGPK